MNLIRTEPVLVSGLVQAVLALLLSFGVGLTVAQVGTIMAVVAAGLAVLARTRTKSKASTP